jgi:hemerythrin superfamily protein
MPTGRTSSHKSSSTSRAKSSTKANDATKLLQTDHREVKKMFADFEKAGGDSKKSQLAEQICLALKVHAQIEEEYFYPAAREALSEKDSEMVDEAVVEHASAKQLIADIEGMDAGDEMFDAKVKVLSEMIDHHVEEEEGELFPKCRKSDMDLAGLATQMSSRKEELMGKMGRTNGRRLS